MLAEIIELNSDNDSERLTVGTLPERIDIWP